MFYSKSTKGFYNTEIHGNNIPSDAVKISSEEYVNLLEGQSQGKIIVGDNKGNPILKDPSPTTDDDEIIAQYTIAIQQRLDNFARTRNYDGILSATTYATSSIPKFKAEGQRAVELRGATWAKCYEILENVESGARAMPNLDELLSELPVLSW